MSWEIYAGERQRQVTWNYSRLFCDVLPDPGIRWFHEKPCSESKEALLAGIEKLKESPDTYIEMMEFAEGWGTYEGAIDVLEWMVSACEECPTGTFFVE